MQDAEGVLLLILALLGHEGRKDEVQPRKVIMVTDDDHFNDALKDAQSNSSLARI